MMHRCVLRCLHSHKVIAVTAFPTFGDLAEGRWPWIRDMIAGFADCEPEDVDCVEDEAGCDIIAVNGQGLAYLE